MGRKRKVVEEPAAEQFFQEEQPQEKAPEESEPPPPPVPEVNGQHEEKAPKNKAEMVRILLAENPDIKPQEAVDEMKKRWSAEMNTQTFSSYKSQILKKERGDSGDNEGESRQRRTVEVPKKGATLKDLVVVSRAVKKVIDRHGKEALADVLALVKEHDAETIQEVAEFLADLSGE